MFLFYLSILDKVFSNVYIVKFLFNFLINILTLKIILFLTC